MKIVWCQILSAGKNLLLAIARTVLVCPAYILEMQQHEDEMLDWNIRKIARQFSCRCVP